MQPSAIVFCYINLFSITKISFDYNAWKNQFKKELLYAISKDTFNPNIVIELDDNIKIEISLSESIFTTIEDKNRLAIEIKVYSSDNSSKTIKENIYLIKPIINKMIESLNNIIRNNVNSAQIPTIDFIFSNKKFYTEPNTKNIFKTVQINSADLQYLFGINELIHLL